MSAASRRGWGLISIVSAALALCMTACGGQGASSAGQRSGESRSARADLSGTVRVDGSNITAPLGEAVAAGFEEANPKASVAVGAVGTGAGFERLCAGTVDVVQAAWLMDERAEELCREAGVRYAAVAVVIHALAVVVGNENPVDCLTTHQLFSVWSSYSKISSWNEIPGLKEGFDEKLALYGPSPDSGNFEYFGEAVTGLEGSSPKTYDDVGDDGSATVAAVEDAPGGMGYVTFPVYAENEEDVKALEIDNGKGCVAPSIEAIQDGSYVPLSRPQYLYLNEKLLKRPAVRAFVDFYFENASSLAESVSLVPLGKGQMEKSKAEAKAAGA